MPPLPDLLRCYIPPPHPNIPLIDTPRRTRQQQNVGVILVLGGSSYGGSIHNIPPHLLINITLYPPPPRTSFRAKPARGVVIERILVIGDKVHVLLVVPKKPKLRQSGLH